MWGEVGGRISPPLAFYRREHMSKDGDELGWAIFFIILGIALAVLLALSIYGQWAIK
jgi:hypothetical protein